MAVQALVLLSWRRQGGGQLSGLDGQLHTGLPLSAGVHCPADKDACPQDDQRDDQESKQFFGEWIHGNSLVIVE